MSCSDRGAITTELQLNYNRITAKRDQDKDRTVLPYFLFVSRTIQQITTIASIKNIKVSMVSQLL